MYNDKPLHRKLTDLTRGDTLPMHMPGGKRRVGRYSSEDITEINGFDNLHTPSSVIKDLEDDLAGIWGADEAFLSVNGATAMIEAAICAAVRYSPDGRILAASNSHLSVWHGIEMSGNMHVTAEPSRGKYPFALDVSKDEIERILSEDPDIKAVVITSPTYEGIMSDTAAIYEITKRYGCVLITDCAHGAHLGTDDHWGPDACGDLVIKSTHKTLSSPTQTAVMLKYSDRVKTGDIRHYIDIFESTSPSYLLMAGVSEMAELLSGKDHSKEWISGVTLARRMLSELKNIKLFSLGNSDISRFVLLCRGHETADILRREYDIEVEASYATHIIAMTGIGDDTETLRRFASAVLKIDYDHPELAPGSEVSAPSFVHTSDVPLGTIARMRYEEVEAEDSAGRVCAEFIYSYPPGIPVLIPGDIISQDMAADLPVRYGKTAVKVIKDII